MKAYIQSILFFVIGIASAAICYSVSMLIDLSKEK